MKKTLNCKLLHDCILVMIITLWSVSLANNAFPSNNETIAKLFSLNYQCLASGK